MNVYKTGLLLAHGLVKNAVEDVMISYLLDNWEKSNLPKAIAIINFKDGIAAIIAFMVVHIASVHAGMAMIVLCTTACHITVNFFI